MRWQKRAIAALALTCLGLLLVGGLLNSSIYQLYQQDLEYNRRECQAEGKTEERKNTKECQSLLYRTLDDPVALLTGALFVATCALFVATYALYAAAASQGADAQEAVRISRATSQTQLRAYLSVKDALVQQIIGTPHLSIVIKLRNFGQTPAYSVQTCIQHAYGPASSHPYEELSAFGSKSIIGPGGEIEIQDLVMFEWDKFETVRKQTSRIFVYGNVIYKDAFGVDRIFSFKARTGAPHTVYNAQGQSTHLAYVVVPAIDGYQAN